MLTYKYSSRFINIWAGKILYVELATFFALTNSFAESVKISSFKVESGGDCPTAELTWESSPGLFYAIESSNSPNGLWKSKTEGMAIIAKEYISSQTVTAPSSCGFFRIRTVDKDGPEISFVQPLTDAVGVCPSDPVLIRLSDDAGIDKSSIDLQIDDQLVDPSLWTFEDGLLTYLPANGNLGANGQWVVIGVSVTDKNGNSYSSENKIRIERPLTILAKSILYVGDAADKMSYAVESGSRSDLPNLRLVEMTESSMTFTGASDTLLKIGQYYLSLMATNVFYRKAVAVEKKQELFVVTTDEASLTDVFSGSISTSTSVQPRLFKTAAQVSNAEMTQLHTIGPYHYSTGKDLTIFLNKFSVSGEIVSTGQISGKYAASVDFDSKLRAVLYLDLDSRFSKALSLSLSADIANGRKEASFPVGIITIPIAPGIWLIDTIELHCNADFNCGISGTITTGVDYGARIVLSARLDGFSWTINPESKIVPWLTRQPTSFSVEAPMSVEIYAGALMSIKLYGAAGLYGKAGLFIKGTSAFTPYDGVMGNFWNQSIIGGFKGELGTMLWSKTYPCYSMTPFSCVLYSTSEKFSPPKLLEFPTDMRIKEGERLELSALATGPGNDIIYCWKKDGKVIRANSSTYIITGSQSATGHYTCEALNKFGSDKKEFVIEYEETNPEEALVGKWHSNYIWSSSGIPWTSYTEMSLEIDADKNTIIKLTKKDVHTSGNVYRWSDTVYGKLEKQGNSYIVGATTWNGYQGTVRPRANIYFAPITPTRGIMDYDGNTQKSTKTFYWTRR